MKSHLFKKSFVSFCVCNFIWIYLMKSHLSKKSFVSSIVFEFMMESAMYPKSHMYLYVSVIVSEIIWGKNYLSKMNFHTFRYKKWLLKLPEMSVFTMSLWHIFDILMTFSWLLVLKHVAIYIKHFCAGPNFMNSDMVRVQFDHS